MKASAHHQFWFGEFVRVLVPSLLTLFLFIWVIYFFILPQLRNHIEGRKLEMIRELTNAAVSSLEVYQKKELSGQMSREQAQQAAKEHLRLLRYGRQGKDYFWINDLDSRLIMHPYRWELEGKDLSGLKDQKGTHPFTEFAHKAKLEGHGYVPYFWQWKDDPSRIAPKLSYVKLFVPWNWVVGTGIYLDDVDREVAQMTSHLRWISFVVLAVVAMLTAFVVYEGLKSEKSRRLAEKQVRTEQERYRSVMEAAAEPLLIYDLEGRVEYCNPAFTRVFGWALSDVQGRKMEFVPPEEREPTMRIIQEVLKGQPCRAFETRRLTRDGRLLEVVISAAMFKDGSGRPSGMVVNLRDLTEKLHLELQLQHAQKMEAIGTLAGGVAHEFNNLIMAVQGYGQLISQRDELDPKLRDYLAKIRVSCGRAADLTRKMLTFSRLEVGKKEAVDLNQLVEGVHELLERTTPSHITVKTSLTKDLPPVLAQAALLEQVLVNLGINACDAITDRGAVTFNTRLVHLSQEFIKANPWARPGPNIQLDVQDDGGGMTQEVLDRIFDPFFTTKEPGRGTGLGLSVAYSIVERIGGHISAQSVPGQGSLFSIWLPAYKGKAKPRPIPSHPQQIIPGKGEHVLVVDDEPHLREITSEMLSAHGYRVATAKNGREALELYRSARENNSPYELVLLDLAMPVMDGQELLNKLKEMDPKAKVVVTTGHGAKSISAKSLTDLADGMLLKPFDMRQLLDIVRRVLGNA